MATVEYHPPGAAPSSSVCKLIGGLFWEECDGIEFKSGVAGGEAIESSGAESVTVPPPDAVGGLLRIAGFVVVVIAESWLTRPNRRRQRMEVWRMVCLAGHNQAPLLRPRRWNSLKPSE